VVVFEAFQVLRVHASFIELNPIIGRLFIDPAEEGLELDKL